MDVIGRIGQELSISEKVLTQVFSLFDEGATIPFIARYRKELTRNLDEVQLMQIKERRSYWTTLATRKEFILKSIQDQGKLTSQLRGKIESSTLLIDLEDLYLPYKKKRQSKGQKAIEQGLKSLAIYIQNTNNDSSVEDRAELFVKGDIQNKKQALEGAVHILAEWISENSWVRDGLRQQFQKYAIAQAKVKKGKKEVAEKFKDYFDYSERVPRMASHRILALFRGEKESLLNFKIEIDEERAYEHIERGISRNYAQNAYVDKAITETYKRILQPSFESEIKKELKEKADVESISVFAENLKQLLLQSPLGAKNILAIDPGFRTGCKIAVLNSNGDFIEHTAIYPHPPQLKKREAQQTLSHLAEKHNIEAVAVGNGTAGIETETLCRDLFKDSEIQVFSVNEAGASIYSASEMAREEFGNLDLTVRGAISIGRRLMDPLAELVKIDAKSIGVGQYQHDVNQPLLKQKLNDVVEHCVNHVGVELNTASYPILAYVSGLGATIAKNIVSYREENGNFTERKQLLKVPKMGKKTYEQAAGFLRIENGKNTLDNTILHPETYVIVKDLLSENNISLEALEIKKCSPNSIENIKKKYGVLTVEFILNELDRPTRDPREPLQEMITNQISGIEDLFEGMLLNGTINNITNFGAFVNIGIKESGLVHVSQISNSFVSNIHDFVQLNQQVEVKVLSLDLARKRIQLTMAF
jgi:uncharacterized protein